MIAVYAGSFNPIHLGHIDIIKRAIKIFGNVVVIVTDNSNKHYTVSIEERIDLVLQAIEAEMLEQYVDVVRLEENESVADFCMAECVDVLIRGIRSNSDMNFEFTAAEVNRDNKIETVFLPCSPIYSNYSSGMVRECIKYDIPIAKYVPISIMPIIKTKYKEEN